MKLSSGVFYMALVAIAAAAKPTYTTPSPYGSYRLNLLKCSCNNYIHYYVHPNWTCFAKAISRDVTTANVYGLLKRDVGKLWVIDCFTTVVSN